MGETRRGAGLSARPEGGLSAQHTGCAGVKPATERSERRGAVILIQRGDPEISAAIAEGLLAGKARTAEAVPVPLTGETGERQATEQPEEQIEIAAVEVDWQRVARRLHVAIGNNRTPDDYRDLIIKARGDYAIRPIGHVSGNLLLAWAMICQGIRRAYRAQDKVLLK